MKACREKLVLLDEKIDGTYRHGVVNGFEKATLALSDAFRVLSGQGSSSSCSKTLTKQSGCSDLICFPHIVSLSFFFFIRGMEAIAIDDRVKSGAESALEVFWFAAC